MHGASNHIEPYLDMSGYIRTNEKCPTCKRAFTGEPLNCTEHLTTPGRYFIDIRTGTAPHRKRNKIYSDPKGHSLSSWDHAYRILTHIRFEIDQGTFDPTKYVKSDIKKYRFKVRIDGWLEDKRKEARKGNLAWSYIQPLERYANMYYLESPLAEMDVRDIRTFHISGVYKNLPDTLSLKYIKNIMDALSHFFNTLYQDDYISKLPKFPSIRVEAKPPEWITKDTQAELFEHIPESDRPIFQFLAAQALRPGEARSLKVKDIDFEQNTLTVRRTFSYRKIVERTKGRNVILRYINPEIVGLLKECCKDKHPEAFIFTNPKNGKPYSENTLRYRWKAAREKIGIDIKCYNGTRHSWATDALNRGVPEAAIAGVLGHADPRATQKYARRTVSLQRQAFEPAEVTDISKGSTDHPRTKKTPSENR